MTRPSLTRRDAIRIKQRRIRPETKGRESDRLNQQLFQRASTGVKLFGQLVVHVEAINILPRGTKERRIQRVNRTLAIDLRKATGLERAVKIAQEHHWPVGTIGVLFIRIVTGVHDQCVWSIIVPLPSGTLSSASTIRTNMRLLYCLILIQIGLSGCCMCPRL